MKNSIVVSDTTAITHMAAIGALRLIEFLFTEIYIPQAVYHELTKHGDRIPGSIEAKTSKWIILEAVKDQAKVGSIINSARANKKSLHAGETEAIVLAKELNADFIIMDEVTGREYATKEGLKAIGMLGILLKAKEKKQIDSVKNYMDLLIGSGFIIGDKLYHDVLVSAGERQKLA